MILPRPRAYVDWTVPVDKNGNEVGVCNDDATFNFYISWLADYLYDDPEHDCFTSPAEFKRICQEKKESLKVPSHIQHADIPYRALFAKLIKSVHDTQERINHLIRFYENFDECASK